MLRKDVQKFGKEISPQATEFRTHYLQASNVILRFKFKIATIRIDILTIIANIS